MSKDNLILFPNKSTSIIGMNQNEVKWMISGTLLLILLLSVGINSSLLAPQIVAGGTTVKKGRALASVNPIFKVSWEKKALESLKDSDERELASIGRNPSPYDSFAFGSLEGKYSIRMNEGRLSQVEFSSQASSSPKLLKSRSQFVEDHLAIFSKEAKSAQKVHEEANGQVLIERYQLLGASGQDLGFVQMILDESHRLISMTVQ